MQRRARPLGFAVSRTIGLEAWLSGNPVNKGILLVLIVDECEGLAHGAGHRTQVWSRGSLGCEEPVKALEVMTHAIKEFRYGALREDGGPDCQSLGTRAAVVVVAAISGQCCALADFEV